jgi:hypothetical protein
MTLAKGPFYSMWIALLYWIGLPLGLGVQMAYAGACALFTRAIRPAIASGALRLAIYSLLLWNPMSYEAPTMGRIIRQQIYTPLGVAILAGLVALYYRREAGFRRQLPWAVLLGLAIGCFWLTREESIWLAPSIALLAGAVVVAAFRAPGAAGRVVVVSRFIYGWFGTVEFHAKEFKDAYGAMMRVKIGPDLPFVPVTRQAREAMYGVSPTFAKLQPFLEGDIGQNWAGGSSAMTHLPAEERQIGGGWLMWALRDAVAAAGYCHNAREALDFYRQMAREINEACDQGRLPASGHRSGFVPPWKAGMGAALASTTWSFAEFVVNFRSFSVYTPISIGDGDELLLFHDLTRDNISSSERAPVLELRNQQALDRWKFRFLQITGDDLRPVLTWLIYAAQLFALLRLVQCIRWRAVTFPFVLAAAAWGGALAYLLVNALVQVTSFNVIAVSTFAPIYPLLLIFVVAAFWDAAAAWRPRAPQGGAS